MEYLKKICFFTLFVLSFFGKGECANLVMILACDTQAENIDETVVQDLVNMRAEGERICSYTGMSLVEYVFTGADLAPNSFFAALKEYRFKSDDTVIFFFSGHGYRTPSMGNDPWPNFYFTLTDQGVRYKEVIQLLQQKKPRLLITLADCCNNVIEDELAALVAPGKAPAKAGRMEMNYKKLFLYSKGNIFITSSKVGQESWCIPEGAIYTLAFLKNIKKEVETAKKPSWSTLLKNASRDTLDYQTPYYKLSLKSPS